MSLVWVRKERLRFSKIQTQWIHYQATEKERMLVRHLKEEQMNALTYAGLLQFCGRIGSLWAGEQVHAHIKSSGYGDNRSLCNHLINMYGKLGSVNKAREMFARMLEKNVVSWNLMITACAQNGYLQDATHLLRHMLLEDAALPNKVTFISILKSCCNVDGIWVHGLISDDGLLDDVAVGTALVNMYGNCGSLSDAEYVFQAMIERNVITWTALMGAYANHPGKAKEMWAIFEEMEKLCIPNEVTFITMLSACRSSRDDLKFGKLIHSRIHRYGFESNNVIQNALISMYGKCGDLECAEQIFALRHEQVVMVTWNELMGAYNQHKHPVEALQLFYVMQIEGIGADKVTFLAALTACASLTDLEEGRSIHRCVVESGLQNDDALKTTLINMYGKCGSLDTAYSLFEEIGERRDVLSWNSMISACSSKDEDVLKLFQRMQAEGVCPDEITSIAALVACTGLTAVEQGKVIHLLVDERCYESNSLWTTLLNMYGRFGDLSAASKLFEKVKARCDVVTWNAMSTAYAQLGHLEHILKLFEKMQLEGIKPDKGSFLAALTACAGLEVLKEGKIVHDLVIESDVKLDAVLSTSLVHMYSKCGSIDAARHAFAAISERSVASWNAIISASSCMEEQGCGEALRLFKRMQVDGLKPDKVTFLIIFTACACQAALREGRLIHAHLSQCNAIRSDTLLLKALVNMYGKCGSIESAISAFMKLQELDLVSWNSMITTYTQHGHITESIHLFRTMQQLGTNPDEITFSSILSACSHAGLVEVGREVFFFMSEDYALLPVNKHYTTMVDMLGRAGNLTEAANFIEKMPCQPNSVAWMTLLFACANYNEVKLGRLAGTRVLELDPLHQGAYVTLSNIVAAERPTS